MKIAALFVLVSLLAGCSRPTRRVVVVFPEGWERHDPRNCTLLPAGSDVLHKELPVLDCDPAKGGAPQRTALSVRNVRDVEFDGSNGESWSCELHTDTPITCER